MSAVAPLPRSSLAALGVLVLALVWLAPLSRVLPPFTAHMTMHMGVVTVAAPLIALGAAGGPLDPVRLAPSLFAPIPVSFVELFFVWGWHAPALHRLARTTSEGLVLEQWCFLVSGVWLWASALGGAPRRVAHRRALGVVALLLTSMHMTLLGALLALAPRVLYTGAGCDLPRGDLSPLEDQQLGGAIMLAAGGAVYLLGGVLVSAGLVQRGRA